MFVSKRALVVVVSLALAVGCTAAEDSNGSSNADPGNGANDSAATNAGGGASANENGAAPGESSSSGGTSSGGTSSSGGSSSGGSSSGGSSGSPAPAASWECTHCSAFATNEATGGPLQFWSMCDGEYDYYKGAQAKSAQLYVAYLGCLCSGPCATECETSLCALSATSASASCKTCLAQTNTACGTTKSACMADVQ